MVPIPTPPTKKRTKNHLYEKDLEKRAKSRE